MKTTTFRAVPTVRASNPVSLGAQQMQNPEKSCSQCRAKKTKCNRVLPRCSRCVTRNLVCQFSLRQKPGPPKGFKKQTRSMMDSHDPENGNRQKRQRKEAEARIFSKRLSLHQTTSHESGTPISETTRDYRSPSTSEILPEQTAPLDILQTLKDQLVDVYSAMKLFPFLPNVRKQHLVDSGVHDALRSSLSDAICAIAARSAPNGLFEHLPIPQSKVSELFAARGRSAYLRYTREEEHPTTLTLVKVAAILAVYQMSCSSGIKSWFMVGEAVRLAYDMRLDQLDSKCHLTSTFMTAKEAEDARYVWWSVYALDVYASSTLMRPFAVTSNAIGTALVSTPEEQFKIGTVNPVRGLFLPSHLVELQTIVVSLDHYDSLDSQTLYLLLLYLARSMTTMRTEQLDGAEIDIRSDLIQNTLATLRFSIPDNFLDHRDGFDVNLRLTRVEIVLLLELQTLCLHSFPISNDRLRESSSTGHFLDSIGQAAFFESFDGNQTTLEYDREWKNCIASASAVVKVVRNLSSQEISWISPAMAAIFWLPALTLFLHQRSRSTAAESTNVASGIEVLKSALKKMGNIWVVAQNFYEALEALCADPVTALTEPYVQCILQSYSSPLVSVSCGRNNVHIPLL